MKENLPLAGARKAKQSKNELTSYFEELLELKKKEIALGETEKGTMDLMGMCSTMSCTATNTSRNNDKSIRCSPRGSEKSHKRDSY